VVSAHRLSYCICASRWKTTINVDSPTQEQHRVPRFNQVMGKDVGSLKHWFVPKVVGCWAYGFMLLHFIVMPNVYGGANLTCTVIYLMLLKLANSDRPIGRHFHLQLDNTTGENKNMTVIAFVAWLMKIHTFHHARIFFLTKGNTKTQLDQSFGTYIRQLQYHCFLTLGSLVLFMYKCTLGKYVGVQPPQHLYCIWDWEKYLEPVIEPISGYATAGDFSGMHVFDFSLTRDGNVQLHMQQSFQSSVASPEGPGYIILKGVPEGVPPLQRLKKAVEWHKSEVQQSTQVASKYFCRLGDQQRIADVVAEWEALFKQMKDDVTQLEPEQRLTFQFPHRSNDPTNNEVDISNGRARLHPDQLPSAHREMLERILYRPSDVQPPRVDPTFGGDRTFADRERERQQLREELRQNEGPSSTNPPIYRQEYLLLQLEGRREPTLHRVMSSATDGFAGRESIDLKLTEYEPFSAPGETANFFSCFRPRPNPEYQRQRHAPEYICIRLQSRSTILVNNVATMGKGLSLRICVDSLKMLAEQSASFQMPSELPASHAPKSSQKSAPSSSAGKRGSSSRAPKPLTPAAASALTIGLTESEVVARRFYFAKAPWSIANSRTIGGGGELAHRAVLLEVLESEVYDSLALINLEELSRSAVILLRKELSIPLTASAWNAGGLPSSDFAGSRVIQVYAATEADLCGCMKLLITPAGTMFIEYVAVDSDHHRKRIATGMFDFIAWRFSASLLALRVRKRL
jgi:hypothetical protein